MRAGSGSRLLGGEALLSRRLVLGGEALLNRRIVLGGEALLRRGAGHGLVLVEPHAAVPPAQTLGTCGIWIPSGCWLRHDHPFSFWLQSIPIP